MLPGATVPVKRVIGLSVQLGDLNEDIERPSESR